jgi:transitional endoplasmic reticulum ATPase
LKRFKEQAKNLPSNFSIGDIMKGQASKRAQEIEQAKKLAESKEERLKQARITPHEKITVTWDSIGGLSKAKATCRRNAEAILEYNKALEEGRESLRRPQHILLYGPPGTGKTLLAKAMAKHCKGFFLDLSGADFSVSFGEQMSGKGMNVEEKIKGMFDIALSESGGKAVVALIDEIDRMGGEFSLGGEELLRILEHDKYKKVIVVATTNYKENLANALLRPERLSKKELINFPSERELVEIIRKVLNEYYQALNKDNQQAFNNEPQRE